MKKEIMATVETVVANNESNGFMNEGMRAQCKLPTSQAVNSHVFLPKIKEANYQFLTFFVVVVDE